MIAFFQLEKQHDSTVRLEKALSKEQYWVKFTKYINEHNYLTVTPSYLQQHPEEEPPEAWEGPQGDYGITDSNSQKRPILPLVETTAHAELDTEVLEMLSELFISEPGGDIQSYTQVLADIFSNISLEEHLQPSFGAAIESQAPFETIEPQPLFDATKPQGPFETIEQVQPFCSTGTKPSAPPKPGLPLKHQQGQSAPEQIHTQKATRQPPQLIFSSLSYIYDEPHQSHVSSLKQQARSQQLQLTQQQPLQQKKTEKRTKKSTPSNIPTTTQPTNAEAK